MLEEKILQVLKENPEGLTITDIAKKVGANRNTVSKYIFGLVKAGKVSQKRIGVVSICYLKEYGEKIKKALGKDLEKSKGIAKFKIISLIIFSLISILILSIAYAANFQAVVKAPPYPATAPQVVQAGLANQIFNFTVNNTDVSQNITQVNITLPSGFSFISDSNGTTALNTIFSSEASLAIWTNTTPEGFVANGSANYFWFNSSVTSIPGEYNFTITTLDTAGIITSQNVTVKVQTINVTINLNSTIVNPNDAINVFGKTILLPDNLNVSNNSIAIWLDEKPLVPIDGWNRIGGYYYFKYRKPILINNTLNSNNLTDYQVLVTLDTASLISAGKMRSDCGDIRFTDSDGSSLLNYWIESGCNTTNTQIWVKVPFIQANSTKTIYVYYGNPSATSLSNGINIFLAFNLSFDGPFGGRTSTGGYHTCALLSDGTAKCWGNNGYGQLGDGTTTNRYTPVAVSGLTNAVAIAAGGYHTCALLSDGTAKCWGNNGYGQLGDGTTTNRYTPVAVSGLTNAVAIAAGYSHTCALLSDGTAKCWGYNGNGQLGDGTTTNRYTPVAVSGLTNAVAIAAGGYHTCALLSDGTAKCWGYNYYGQLGDGTTTNRYTPVAVSGLTNAVAIAAGYSHTCALLSDGTAKCWGYNYYGQLGDGTTTNRYTPVAVSGLTNAVAIAAGDYHTCALLSDGTAKCWGNNGYGQLGDGTTTNRYTPVAVSGLTNAVAIAAGYSHTCALLSDGTAKCWGYNGYGQLGDGTTTNRYTPVAVSNYNLGGRYDKTNGIPATIQKPPYFQDTYFIRKYTTPEPTTSIGNEEIVTSTDSFGNYNYTFNAPLEVGNHVIKVNLTNENGIYGENSTSFTVVAGNLTIPTINISQEIVSKAHNFTLTCNVSCEGENCSNVRIFAEFNGYRKPILINNTLNSNNLTDYQVLVNLDTASLISAGKMRSDCGDIRFTDSDGSNLLNYWIESGCNSTNTKIWVKVPFIPANSTKTIYVYYGNQSATSLSNGDNTFDFFDDFESYPADSDINGQGGWITKRIGGSGEAKVRVMNGRKHLRLSSTSYGTAVVNGNIGLRTVNSSLGYALEAYDIATAWNEYNGEGFANGDAIVTDGSCPYNGYNIGWLGWSGAYSKIRKCVNGTITDLTSISDSASNGVYYRHTFIWIGSSLQAYRDGVLKTQTTDTSHNSFTHIFLNDWSGATWNHDWIAVRKYTSPEPTTSIGNEEIATQFSPIPTSGNYALLSNANPYSCGKVLNGSFCNYTFNILANSAGNYSLRCRATQDAMGENVVNQTISETKNVSVKAGWLEVLLNYPITNLILNKTDTFPINATVICHDYYCGNVSLSFRLNETSSLPTNLINSTTSIKLQSGANPYNCGIMDATGLNNVSCNYQIIANITIKGARLIDVNVSSNDSQILPTETSDILVEGRVGNLIVNLTFLYPTTINVGQNFTVNGTITCLNYKCFTDLAWLRYNKSSSYPDYIIPSSNTSGIAFFVDSQPKCNSYLEPGQSCSFSWNVASRIDLPTSSYLVGILGNSTDADVLANVSNNVTVTVIDNLLPIITNMNINVTSGKLYPPRTVVRLNSTISDNNNVSLALFEFLYPNSSLVNLSAVRASGSATTFWYYDFSDTLQDGNYTWQKVYAKDFSENWNSTSVNLNFTIDAIAPNYTFGFNHSGYDEVIRALDNITFYSLWQDYSPSYDARVSYVIFSWNGTCSGSWINETYLINKSISWVNLTKTLDSCLENKTVGFRFYGFDLVNNSNATPITTFYVNYSSNFTYYLDDVDRHYDIDDILAGKTVNITAIYTTASGIFLGNASVLLNLTYNDSLILKNGKLEETSFYINQTPFLYRKSITINNTLNSNNLTDYQVLVNLDTASLISAGKMRSDCGDIRFTDSDGSSLLNYWIESGCNTTNTKIWVKVPFIQASSTKTIYVYYGNPSATSLSNGTAAFLFYTDWETGTLEGWNILNGGGTGSGNVVFLDGSYQLKLNAPNTNNRVQANKAFSSSNTGMMIEAMHKTGATVGDGVLIGFSDGTASVPGGDEPKNGYYFSFARWSNTQHGIEKTVSATRYTLATTTGSAAGSTYYLLGFSWLGSTLKAWINRSVVLSVTDSTFTSQTYVFLGSDYYDDYFDWIFVRKYTSPEPTTSVGNEEITSQYSISLNSSIINNLGKYNFTIVASKEGYPTRILTGEFYLENISVSLNLNATIVNPNDAINVFGKTILLPDNLNVSNNSIAIWLDEKLLAQGLCVNNSCWSYIKPITINNTLNSNNLTDYQVLVNLDTASLISAGKMRSDCGDIRFTDSDGSSLLNYWIESGCNTTNTKIWVKVPFIQASSTKTIYVYYGNSNATSQSNGNATFILFDDFDTKDTTKWLWIDSNYGAGTVSGGIAYFPRDTGIVSTSLYSSSAIVRARMKLPSGVTQTVRRLVIILTYSTSADNPSYFGQLVYPGDAYRTAGTYLIYSAAGTATVDGTTILASQTRVAPANDAWYIVELARTGNSLSFKDGLENTLSATDTTLTGNFGVGFGSRGNYPINAQLDWILMRNYVSPEPTTSVGNEEIATSTDSFGNYNYTFNAPLEVGNHVIKVNLTNENGIYGENSTSFYVRGNLDVISETYYDIDNIMIKINETGRQADIINVNITIFNSTNSFNFACSNSTDLWTCYATGLSLGNYTLYAFGWNSTSLIGFIDKNIQIQNISISLELNDTIVNPNDSIEVRGKVLLLPDNINVTNTNVSIWINEAFNQNCTTNNFGEYSCIFNAPLDVGTYTIKVNLTSANGIYGENSTSFYVASIYAKIYEFPSKANRGDTISIKSYVLSNSSNTVNLTNVWLNYSLPDYWNITSQTNLFDLLEPNQTKWNNATIQILKNASIGIQRFNITAMSSEGIKSYDNASMEIWGWANLTEIKIANLFDTNKLNRSISEVACRVLDSDTLQPIANYPVNFYKNDSLQATNYTNSSGYAVWYWNSYSDLGPYTIKCGIANNSTLYYNAFGNETSINVEVWRKLNLTLYIDQQEIYRNDTAASSKGKPYSSNLTANVKDENGDVEYGITVEFWRETTSLGTSVTINGNATKVHNPPDTITPGDYTIKANVSSSYSWPSEDTKIQTIKGFLYPTIDSPSNNQKFFKNETISLLSTTRNENSGIEAVNATWSLVETNETIGEQEDANWTIPINHSSGTFTLRLNVSKQFFDPAETNITIEIYQGFANITELLPEDGSYNAGTIIPVTCRVRDANTSIGLENYPVNFYKNDSLQATNYTNSSGYAVWYWNTTLENAGVYAIKCNITDNATLNYIANIKEMQTSIGIIKALLIDEIARTQNEIYRKDTYSPYNSTVIVHVLEAALGPSENATVHFYNSTSEFASCITNSSGYCNITYNPPDSIEPNNYTFYINATKTEVGPSLTNQTWIIVKGKLLSITINSPAGGTYYHKTDTIWLNSTVLDENNLQVLANVSWYNSTSLIASGGNVQWQIPATHERGSQSIKANATKDYYDPSPTDTVSIYIYGWAEPEWISPNETLNYGNNYNLICKVKDTNTTEGIANYNTSFWYNNTFIASNLTNSSGFASVSWYPPTKGIFELKCNITSNSTLFYDATGVQAIKLLEVKDVVKPLIFDSYISPTELEVYYENVTIRINASDDISVDKVWANISLPNGGNEIALMSIVAGNSSSGRWEVNYTPQKTQGGIHNVTIYANDTSGNLNSTYIGYFVAYNQTTGKLEQLPQTIELRTSQLEGASFVLNLTLYNTGNATMRSSKLYSTSYPTTWILTNLTQWENLTITKGSNYTAQWNVSIPQAEAPGNYYIEGTGKWVNPNPDSVDSATNSTIVTILKNPILNITQNEFSDTMNHSSEKTIGSFYINSTGNYELSEIYFNKTVGNLSESWVEFWSGPYVNYLPSIANGSSKLVYINITIPKGQDAGIYKSQFVVNATNSTQYCSPIENCWKYLNITINVTEDWSWKRSPSEITQTVKTSESGFLQNITITNEGNMNITFVITKDSGNASSLIIIPDSITVPHYPATANLTINYSIPANQPLGFYKCNVSITNSSASPTQLNVTINLNVEDGIKPWVGNASLSKLSLEANYEKLNISADATDNIQVDKVWAVIESPSYTHTIELTYQGGNNYRAEYTPTKGGIHNVTIYANDTSGNLNSTFAGSFNVTGIATGYEEQNPQSQAATGITLANNYTFDLTAVLKNTGSSDFFANGTMRFVNLTLSFSEAGVYANSTFEQCGNISVGQNCTKTFKIYATVDAIAGHTIYVNVTSTWKNPDGSIANATNRTSIYIEPNPVLTLDKEEIVDSIAHGTWKEVNYTVQNFGNDVLSYIQNSAYGGNLSSNWLIFTPSTIVSLGKKNNYTVIINVSIPLGQDPGIYLTNITSNATGTSCNPASNCWDSLVLNISVPWDKSWSISPSSQNLTIPTSTTGNFTINVKNLGNVNVTYSIAKSGDAYAVAMTSCPASIFVPKASSINVTCTYNSTDIPGGNYTLNLRFQNTTGYASPEYYDAIIGMQVFDIPPNIDNPSVSPSIVDQNYESVTISASISDNIQIDKVWINITKPDQTTELITKSVNAKSYSLLETYTPTQSGIYYVRIYANDTQTPVGAINYTQLFNFTSIATTSVSVIPNVTSAIIQGITQNQGASLPLNVTLNNTGQGGAYWSNLTFSLPTGWSASPSLIDYQNITEGSWKSSSTTINIPAGTPPGLYNASLIAKWTNPSNSLGQSSQAISINVTSNPVLDIVQSAISITMKPEESNSTYFTLNSTGNDAVNNIIISCIGKQCTDFSITTTPSSISSLSPNSVQNITVNLSIPAGYSPGIYDVMFNCSGDKTWDKINLTINVAEDWRWSRNPENFTKTVGTESTGLLGIIEVSNLGNIPILFNITKEGNASQFLILNATQLTVGKLSKGYIKVEFNTSAQDGFFQANISITNSSAIPAQQNVTVNLRVIKLRVDILSPTQANPLLNVRAGDTVKIEANATFEGILTENMTWKVYFNETECPITGYNFSVDRWKINCTAPSIQDAKNYTLYVYGTYTTYEATAVDHEDNAIAYADVSPPVIANLTSNSTKPGGNVTITADLIDNVKVAQGLVEISYPNGTKANFTLVNITPTKYQFNFTDTFEVGDYDYKLYAFDSENNVNVTQNWFEVYTEIMFNGTTKDQLGNPVKINFELYRPGKQKASLYLIHNFSSNETTGEFNKTLHNRSYDALMTFYKDKLEFAGLEMKQNMQQNILIGNLSAQAVNIPNATKLRGIAINMSFNFTNVTITLDYSNYIGSVSVEDNIKIYKCENWNFATWNCDSGWVMLPTTLDKINHRASTTSSSLSAYFVAEYVITAAGGGGGGGAGGGAVGGGAGGAIGGIPPNITMPVCGNGICEVGESWQNCPEDCPAPAKPIQFSTETIEVTVAPGESQTISVGILNNMNEKINASLSAEGRIWEFVQFEKTSLEIMPLSTEYVSVRFYATSTTLEGTYIGNLVVKAANVTSKVPVRLIVKTKPTPLLDINLDVLTPKLMAGENLNIRVRLYTFGEIGRVDVTINYTVEKAEVREIILTASETVAVERKLEYTKSILLPKDLEEGRYLVEAFASYDNKTASAIASFEVVKEAAVITILRILLKDWRTYVAIFAIIVGYFALRKYIAWKIKKATAAKKYVFPLDFRKLPKGVKVGKIAETNIDAYWDLDKLTQHMIIAGGTGSGKTVAAMVIAEEALKKGIPCIVFDPTAQWTGFARACRDEHMLKLYPKFGLKREDATAFKTNIIDVVDPEMDIDIEKYVNKGEITVFCLTKLTPSKLDAFVTRTIDSIFKVPWEESRKLKLLIIYDEVHRLLPKYGGKKGYLALERGVREFRKWGIGLIMISQVLSDFKGAIRAVIASEGQMRTKYSGDIERVKKSYGANYAATLPRLKIGIGMVQNPEYNEGRPWFIEFRPLLHDTSRISEKELALYRKYQKEIAEIEEEVEKMKKKGIDTYDIELELKLAKEKVKQAQFRMAETYIESLKARIKR